ncbi:MULTISPECIES: toll/interleukin-1 receptor domain-containing protein [unclassified Rhizobium]|uniref:toll/interleukin-1 receptor domain-containing protein n=1 Tax=unclassified Rhizobium TaxID=2613769 RepID=UPI001A99E9E1|nr:MULTISPECIES: toll/interleukin-1 receptor domain-containing protein [unclassified Rhizobium]MBX5164523.1 toll/interleukin-1 receptor domain-containing protein [Rhizobium sp. NZLR4b]MBX5190839.1 toll/interleukin-1 receptor domain-containing protein [Rhizobium sp. NZLR3b]MBX5204454.1 toll/interleukin-1 receptor domain-containing protein [Rhizobium sp. NZLR1]QSZ24674.1 toll/interleukin-1 receptor domain-containing protein [Rhizobium sp. NZLR1]
MATFITERQVRAKIVGIDSQTARIFIAAHNAISAFRDSFDIFLSHSIKDAGLILGLKRLLEDTGKTVYIDWIDDPDLDREHVSGETAEKLRRRMDQCSTLIYVYSQSSQRSRWMPWELGYFDGSNGNVAILPITPDHGTLDFDREEYLQLYPKIDVVGASLFVNQSRKSEIAPYKTFDEWRNGDDKLRPR